MFVARVLARLGGVILGFAVFGCLAAWGDGTPAVPGFCNTAAIDDIDQCVYSWGSGLGQSAHLTLNATTDGTGAGTDYFGNYLKATYTTAGAPEKYSAANSATWGPVPSYPNWTVAQITASLLLTGSVEFPDAGFGLGSINLDLTGWLVGGDWLQIDAVITPSGLGGSVTLTDTGVQLGPASPQTASCMLGFCSLSSLFGGPLEITDPAFNVGNPGTPAELELDISSSGRVIYDPDNSFVGAPEPATLLSLALYGAALLDGLAAARIRPKVRGSD
jgi:hypothetical protein